MKNWGISWGNKGVKMKVSFEVEGGENGFCSNIFSYGISRISEFKMETTVKIETRAWCLQESSRNNIF